MADRKKIEQEWLELKKQQYDIQLKLQVLDYAMRCEDDEMVELFTKPDIRIGGSDIQGVVLVLGDGNDVYLFETVEGWVPKLKLKEKVSKDKYIELENEAKK